MGLMASSAHALVEHPNTDLYPNSEETPLTLIPDRPDNSVVGWWSYNASAVAIAPNYILTTCHQGGGVAEKTKVNFGGVDYKVVEVFQHGKADIRIARIVNWNTGADANLTSYVTYNSDQTEISTPPTPLKTAVIGGFGYGRAAGTYTGYYKWDATTGNKTERWGQNKLESVNTYSNSSDPSAFATTVLTASFDNYGTPNWVDYEACVAPFDSGGGWFLRQNGTGPWQVAGLSRGVTIHDAPYSQTSWFNPADGMDCVRVSSYATWLNNVFNPSKWNSPSGGNWSTGGNWSGSVPSGQDKWAVFSDNVSASRTVMLDANYTIGTLRFDCPGDLTISATGSNQLTFSVYSAVDAPQIETGNTPGNGGAISITAPIVMDVPLVVRHNSGGTLTISGQISGSGNRLTKAGTGLVVLTGTNTYSGGTAIIQGTLRVTNASSLGTGSSNDVTLAGATLDVQSDSALTLGNKVKVIPNPVLGVSASTLNVDRATAGTPRTMTFSSTLTTSGVVTLSTTSITGCSAAFSGLASIANLGSTGVATINTDTADLALTGGLWLASGTLTKSGQKMLTLSGTQGYGSGTTLKVTGGTLALNADAGSPSAYRLGVVTSNSSAVAFGATQHLASLSLGGASSASVAAGGTKTLLVKSLDIAGGASPTARLDMADNNLIVDYSGSGVGPLTQVRDWVKAGANFDPKSGDLLWNGNGITSSTAAAGDHMLVGLGVRNAVDAGAFAMPTLTALEGVAVDSTATLVKYTYLGDVNLDGKVDQNDYDVMDYYQVFGTGGEAAGAGWWTGDLNGNGVTNQDDYDMADYGQVFQGAPLGAAGPGLSGLSVLPQDTGLGAVVGGAGVVPEPGTLLVLFAGAAGLLRRRRRAL